MLALSFALLLPALCYGVPVVEVDGTAIMGRTLEHTGQEVFRGEDVSLSSHAEAQIFARKGIPYAEAPVGELRFQPPRPKKLPTLINATEFGVACLQPVNNPHSTNQ